MRHLTWRGRLDVIYYAARRLFIAPAPDYERCIMGYPIDPAVRCPRPADVSLGLWCKRHQPEATT